MNAKPIAAKFTRALTGVLDRSRTRAVETAPTGSQSTTSLQYPLPPKATSSAEAWSILNEHRALITAAIAAGLFVV